jgi:hypothetical protein
MLADASSTDSEKPGIEEIYERATNTSNLKQEAERRTSADVLRDMAMSASRLGSEALRLRGQWASAEKPTRQRTRTVKQWAEILPLIQQGEREVRDKDGKKVKVPNMVADLESARAANEEESQRHDEWFERAMEALIGQLPSLAEVRAAVAVQALKWNMDSAEHKAAAVVKYWLNQNCRGCDGRKWQLIPGSPSLSNKMCRVCQGSGVAEVPHGQDGRKLANHLDQCVHRYKQTMRTRRKALGSIPPIDRLAKRLQVTDESD